MLLVRVHGQRFDAFAGHKGGRRGRLCRAGSLSGPALILLAGLVVIIPCAYASPPDPTWIEGIYDAADCDDAVDLLTGMNAALPLEGEARPIFSTCN
jgi:hypothetical protein